MNTKERFLGLLRELLTAGGAIAFGAFDGTAAIIGLIVAIFSVIWALAHHEGLQIVATSTRKALSLVPGVLLALGVISPDKASALAAFIAPLFAIIWSFLDKGGSVPSSGARLGAFLMTMLALSSFGLVSCAGQYTTLNAGYYKETSPFDPQGEFGAFASLTPAAKEKLSIPVLSDK